MKILSNSLKISQDSFPICLDNFPRSIHFSLAWRGNKFLGMATNSAKTSPRNLRNQPLNSFPVSMKKTCSEMALFLKLRKRGCWNKATLVNIRINRQGVICNSRPCRFCENLIDYIAPKQVWYTGEDGEFKLY